MQTAPAAMTAIAVPTAAARPVDDAPAPSKDAPAPPKGAPAPTFEPVRVSDEPEERFTQLLGFFRRNPGWMKTGPVADSLRGALDEVPKVGEFVRDLTEPSDVGYGQGIRDQTRWQITTGRQPNNAWWLRMNRQLVEDPLTAERAIRTGTVDQLQSNGQKAWAEYIRRSDLVYRAMGLTPDQMAKAADEGRPLALSDTYRGVGLLRRAYVQMVLKPYARKALWIAHRKTLEDGRAAAGPQAEEMYRKAPREMSFSSSWATLIGYWSHLSPPITGNESKLAQKVILPDEETIDGARLSWTERAFTKFADILDPKFEREIKGPIDRRDREAARVAAGKLE